jgi:alpha-beta hydrolase superfamily lysophospholipase
LDWMLLPQRLSRGPRTPFRVSHCVRRRGGGAGGVVVLPGLGNADKDYKELVEQLQSRNMTVRVAQVARYDWLRNAAGLTKKSYWEGTLTPRPTVDWYLERISAAVTEVQAETQGPVCLLAHSAGGWMARVWLAEFGSPDDVHSLVCLGSPLNPPPEETDVLDQTRGILTYVNTNMPGAFHKDVNYVCVTGKFIEVRRSLPACHSHSRLVTSELFVLNRC